MLKSFLRTDENISWYGFRRSDGVSEKKKKRDSIDGPRPPSIQRPLYQDVSTQGPVPSHTILQGMTPLQGSCASLEILVLVGQGQPYNMSTSPSVSFHN